VWWGDLSSRRGDERVLSPIFTSTGPQFRRGTVVPSHVVAQLIEALRYKPEGRGFDSRWCYWNFIDIIIPAALWPCMSPRPLTEISTRSTVMRRITTFRSTTDRIYDGGPIRLQYCNIIPLCYNCLQYSVQ